MPEDNERYGREFKLGVHYDTQEQLSAILEEVAMKERVVCKHCGSGEEVVRFGYNREGKQRYWCKRCERVFLGTKALPRMRVSIRQLGDVLGQYYGGMSLKEIRRQFDQQYRVAPSRSSVYRWLVRFTKVAKNRMDGYRPQTGKVWIADETVLKVAGRNVWHYDVLDAKTRFLLASYLSDRRTIRDAQKVMEMAYERCGRIPDIIITDKQPSYTDGIERAFGADTRHIRIKGFDAMFNTNLIERWHGTLKQRTKVMRGLKNLNTARLLLDGWLIHYNFFRTHQTLRNRTPAEVAGIKAECRDWLDVVRSESPLTEEDAEAHEPVLPIRASPQPKRKAPRRRAKRKPLTVLVGTRMRKEA